MEKDRLQYPGVLAVGLLVVAGVIYSSLAASSTITGAAVLGEKPYCCLDCSCISDGVCASCGQCLWVRECGPYGGGLNPEGLELVHAGRTQDGSIYTINAVMHPVSDGRLLLVMTLPNGFEPVTRNPMVVGMRHGETVIVPLKVFVKENVAEQKHLIRVELLNYNWDRISSAEASVGVYSGRDISP